MQHCRNASAKRAQTEPTPHADPHLPGHLLSATSPQACRATHEAETLQARVHTEDTVAEATSLLCRLTAWIEELPHSPAEKTRLLNRLPQATTSTWICRVRKAHSLTPQSVNAKYKVSYDKLVARMGVAWRNAARLMALREILLGPGKLRFLSPNDKPN